MKKVLLFSMLFCAIALPGFAELTDADLNKIRLVVQEEVKKEIESAETRIKEYIDLKIEGVDKQFAGVDKQFAGVDKQFAGVDKQFVSVNSQITHVQNVTYGLIALIVVAVGIPQIVMAWRERGQKVQAERVENLENQISIIAKKIGAGSQVIG